MNAIPIVPSQSSAAKPSDAPSDTPSGGQESDSGFGPILQAAAASTAGATPQASAQSAPAQGGSGGPKTKGNGGGADRKATGPDAATERKPAGPDATAAQPTEAGRIAGQPVDPNTAAAAAPAIVLAAQSRPEPMPAGALSASPAWASGVTAAASSSALDAGVRSSPQPDESARAAGQIAAQAQATSRPAAVPDAQAPLDSSVEVTAPPNPAQAAGRPPAGNRIAASDVVNGAPSEALLDPGASSGTVPASAASASLGDVPALAQALASALPQGGSRPAETVPLPRGPATAAAPVPADLAAPSGAAPGIALGAPVATYTPEARASVATPVSQPGFGQELSDRVVMLTRSGVQSAQISLEPAGLGPVAVSIQLHGHAATLAFTAASETTRNALEAALPRLREMFASCGMQLSDATVGGRAQPDWSAPARQPAGGWDRTGGTADAGTVAPADPAATTHATTVRLVDTYA